MKYTISQVMPTGESSDMYGTEYHIKFNEDAGTYKLWYKTEPQQGQEQEGEIVDGKFKKAKKEWNGATDSGKSYKKPYAAVQADKNDGQRQGMCINNAANQILKAQEIQGKVLGADVWAGAVYEYAQALYAKGDLKAPETTEEGLPIIDVTDKDAPEGLAALLGVQK